MKAQCPQCKTILDAKQIDREYDQVCPECNAVLTVPPLDPPIGVVEGVSERRRCPFCAETILPAVIKCKHCGSSLAPGKDKRVGRLSAVGVLGVLVGVAFFCLPFYGCIAGNDFNVDGIIPLYIIGMIFVVASVKWARR